jgi:tetratricopeptide (TPR) repeat protein
MRALSHSSKRSCRSKLEDVRAAVLLFGLATCAAGADLESLADQGHYLRLKALVEPLVKADPTDAKATYFLAEAEAALGNLDIGLKLAEQAVALDPKSAKSHALLAGTCGRVAQSAGLLKQLQYARRAKKELDTALELDPNNEGALYGLALFYYAAPSMLGGDKQKAQVAAELLTKLNPVRGYLTQAKLATERKDPAAEEDFYKKAIAADPTSYDAKIKLGTFYLSRNLNAAWDLANEALTLNPGQADAWKLLAQVHIGTQCWEELRATLEAARAEIPDDLSPYYYSAVALEQSGHFFNWAADFLDLYLSNPPEGEEPTLAEAEKASKRVKSIAVRAAL